MSASQEDELVQLLAGPPTARRVDERQFVRLANDLSVDPLIRSALRFHALGEKVPPEAPESQMPRLLAETGSGFAAPEEEEIVEDAGLFDHDAISVANS